MKVGDIVAFIIKHRRGKAFYRWAIPEITQHINDCIEDNSIAVVTHDGMITGVVTAHLLKSQKVLFITNILSIRKGVIKPFMELKEKLYPDYSIEGNRRGFRKEFTPELLKQFQLKGI